MFYVSNKQHIILTFYTLFTFLRDKPKRSVSWGEAPRTALVLFLGKASATVLMHFRAQRPLYLGAGPRYIASRSLQSWSRSNVSPKSRSSH
jgi:hypothetical protein